PNALLCCGRLLHRRGLGLCVIIQCDSGPVVGTHQGELANLREHSWVPRFRRAIRIFGINQICPVVVSASRSRYKHHCRRTGAAAFEIYLAAATDVEQAGRAAGFRSRSDDHLKEANKSYSKEKTHARKQKMISIAMYIRRSTHSIPAHSTITGN